MQMSSAFFDFTFWKWVAVEQRAGDDLKLLADAISLSKMSSASSHGTPRGGSVSVCLPSCLQISLSWVIRSSLISGLLAGIHG